MTPRSSSRLIQLVLALLSAALLVISFPRFNQFWCAWIALVPWLLLLRQVKGRGAFWWSWTMGFLFFLGSIWWLTYVTIFGWVTLCAFLALYFGLFGWFVSRLRTFNFPLFTLHFVIPSGWVALEYARTHLLSGFGWNLLGYSQSSWLPIIQFADVTGVWGVSFLIVSVNVLLATVLYSFQGGKFPRLKIAALGMLGLVVMGAAMVYGMERQSQFASGPSVLVSVVQGNIPQSEKWDDAYRTNIQQRYAKLTGEAARGEPDLIVWPETSVPGYFNADEQLTQWVFTLAKHAQRPLLIGAPVPSFAQGNVSVLNSAVLIGPEGAIRQRYDKLRLVAFREFIPFERFIPWLRNVLPPIGDFAPGTHYTVFNLGSGVRGQGSEPRTPNPELQFSVLVCFEDIFPELARRFVREGARLLVVITNDAWFGPTAAAYQHAQASTLRAVELRVPVARAANTGWSGCIDQAGRWIDSVHDAAGQELFVAGTQTCALPVRSSQTLYLRFGDWFAFLCIAVVGIISAYGTRSNRQSSRKAR